VKVEKRKLKSEKVGKKIQTPSNTTTIGGENLLLDFGLAELNNDNICISNKRGET
jgi:hypothetical protein